MLPHWTHEFAQHALQSGARPLQLYVHAVSNANAVRIRRGCGSAGEFVVDDLLHRATVDEERDEEILVGFGQGSLAVDEHALDELERTFVIQSFFWGALLVVGEMVEQGLQRAFTPTGPEPVRGGVPRTRVGVRLFLAERDSVTFDGLDDAGCDLIGQRFLLVGRDLAETRQDARGSTLGGAGERFTT